MKTRKLGSLDVTVAGLGCNNFGRRCDAAETAAVVAAALDSGIAFFDTADIYGGGLSEEYLGRALGSRRDDVVVATKFGMEMGDPERSGGSASWVRRAAEDSLRRLGTDRIDLYQMHRPDPATPIEETLEALDALVREGKVREIGCSNFSAQQIEEADAVASERGLARFVSAQNHYNLLVRQVEELVIPACERLGLGMLPYFPLASGLLTGKYRRGEPAPAGTRLAGVPPERARRVLNDDNFAILDRLGSFAAGLGVDIPTVALSWLAARPAVASVIAGATRPEQARANARSTLHELSPDDVQAVTQLVA